MMTKGIMQLIGKEIDRAFSEGTTFEQFLQSLKPTLQKKGWWEDAHTQRWLDTIFHTNLHAAYAARRWGQIQRTKKTQPYLCYKAILDNETQPECRALHNIVRPVDDPFWDDFYPYTCRCSVQQISERDLERLGLSVTKDEDLPKAKNPY